MSPHPHLLLSLLLGGGCASDFTDPTRAFDPPVPADTPLYPVDVHVGATTGVVDTTERDIHGTPTGVACVTCHGPASKDRIVDGAGAPETFHTGVDLVHGSLTCNHCHDPNDRSLLRLADGANIELYAVISLCAQCHGPQYRDYQHGAHGGMTGYWDLRQGPRDRNNCVDCHAPHTPAFEGMHPVLPPADRFLSETRHD